MVSDGVERARGRGRRPSWEGVWTRSLEGVSPYFQYSSSSKYFWQTVVSTSSCSVTFVLVRLYIIRNRRCGCAPLASISDLSLLRRSAVLWRFIKGYQGRHQVHLSLSWWLFYFPCGSPSTLSKEPGSILVQWEFSQKKSPLVHLSERILWTTALLLTNPSDYGCRAGVITCSASATDFHNLPSRLRIQIQNYDTICLPQLIKLPYRVKILFLVWSWYFVDCFTGQIT